MPTVIHFEIPADNIDRAQNFYSKLFLWEFENRPTEYWRISNNSKNHYSQPVTGGMMKRQHKNEKITNYIGVQSLDEYIHRVEMLGGKIITPKTPVSGMGYFAFCIDTEENTFALWEDNINAK